MIKTMPGTLGEAYHNETARIKDEMRKLFKLRTMSNWLHLTADLMLEELDELPKNNKRTKELATEAAAVRKAAYETHHTRK